MRIEPKNRVGKSKEFTSEILMTSAPDASRFFVTVGDRLLHPGQWHTLTRKLGAMFYPTDSYGDITKKGIQEENYIKIKIPGMWNWMGRGYDWVQVESLSKTKSSAGDCELLEMRIRPSRHPKKGKYAVDSLVTSSFLIERIGRIVKVTYFRWNEASRIRNGDADVERPAIVAFGQTLGLPESKWIMLLKGLLNDA